MPEPAVTEVVSGAPVLVVAFGGVKHGIGIDVPPFEFLRSLSAHGCDAIFLRDVRQAWYQLGIDGVAGDIDGLARWLRQRRQGYVRTVAIGNSMGGYASLLFGRLAAMDVMIAFNPQTTIAASDLGRLGDRRWQPLIERVYAHSADSRYHDVRAALAESATAAGTSLLFYGAQCREDAGHAMRLAGAPGCHLFAVRETQHQAVRVLRDGGVLSRVFDMVCDPSVGVGALLDELRSCDRLVPVGSGNPDGAAAEAEVQTV
jgi:hypothetical protein